MSTQSVACFYDTMLQERENDCSHTQVKRPADASSAARTMVITHKFTARSVLMRLSQMAEIVVSEKLVTKSDLFKEKFNWYKEIEKLKSCSPSSAELLFKETSTHFH
eukprot:TRINITY_DN20268_c0_g1_i1.p2 TRINITY_DN20268_c0_g1~~TRINITY_DN20268_c0_g1_i1.p2  ORF type:complete len:107 (-),score=21.49 TRINITY_DN20268_c0_g1_i1:26-346(-)